MKCYYCGFEDPNHDGKCPALTRDESLLSEWHRGWGHGFKGTVCLYPENPPYFLGYKMGRLTKEESDKRVATLNHSRI